MANKIFSKILDSSIWSEPYATRIVWLTFLAVMDETGLARFKDAGDLAKRAKVELYEAGVALQCLCNPDPKSSDQDHDGRRIKRVPEGWVVLNASKYHNALLLDDSYSTGLTVITPETIYQAYPRKEAPRAAVKAIKHAFKFCPPAKLLAATQAYAEAVKLWPKEKRQYIPHATTWFNRGSYDDDPVTWTKYDSNQKRNDRGFTSRNDYSDLG